MSNQEKEEMKSIKITATAHAKLLFLKDVLELDNVSAVVNNLVGIAYPEVDEAMDKIEERKERIRGRIRRRLSEQER